MLYLNMWLLFKSFPYTVCCKNVISALESVVSEYGAVEEFISGDGKQKLKNNPPSSHQSPQEQWSSLSKRQGYAGHDANAKELPPLPLQQPVWLQKAPNVSLCQPATMISKPGKSTPRSYVVSTSDGAKYWWNRLMRWRGIMSDEKLPVPLKASSVNIGATIVQAPQFSESDSPRSKTQWVPIIIKVA